ncbi:MAG: adenine methyltransferase, partial [Eubacterium sp.]|nr:adenine methyltransferase [Eubacterium sp.]
MGSELEADSLSTLNPSVKYEQMSLFPLLEEQMGTILAAEAETNVKTPAAFSISDEDISEILKTGSGQKDSRARIFEKYREEHTPEYMSEFLKKEYRTGGKGFEINGSDISVWYNSDGMSISHGRSAVNSPDVYLTWDDVESRTRNIIEAGDYFTGNEAFISEQTYRAELADNIYFFYRDAISEEPKGFELKQNNYPDSTEQIREMLSTPEGAVTICDDILDRVDALRRGEIEQHWRLNPSPGELADKITGFSGPKRELPTKDSVEIMSESFITQDEIDSVLSGGSGFAGGKFRIYDFVMEGHDRKELADFLKKEYGTGGRTSAISGSWHSYEDYDAKGIQLQKGNIMEPYAKVLLNWNVVAKRIEQLVFEGRYLTPEQKEEHDRKALEAAQADIAYSEDALLDKAINLINDYCIDEFSHEADFKDMYNVELAYTEVTDEETGNEHTVQVSADLIDYSISMFIDDEKLDTEKYESLEALIEYELNYLNFDSLVSVPDDVWDKVRERDSVSSEHTESVSTEHTDSDIENEGITSNNITDSGSVDKNALEMQDNALERLNEGIEFADSEEETSGRKVQKLDGKNYHITDNNLGEGTQKEKFQRNVLAINTLQKIEEENRTATTEEQEILAQYVGWGGLADAFDETKSNWSSQYSELKNLLSPEEYASARESTLNAHYTSPDIIRGIYNTLERFGFEKGNILEPSMGVGNFFGMLPESMEQSRLYGVELDSISGRIARQLYPKADVQIKGFEKTTYPNDFFDVAIGNVPFGQYKVQDKEYDKHNFLIHDYFFAKTLDKVRPGGVIAFVTSKGTMDKVNESVRKFLAERAELLGAVRLPNTAFKANAGTEVTSDILIFKKRDRLVKDEPDWIHTKENADGIQMNAYFADHPEMIVGHMEMVSGPFGMESACLPDASSEKSFSEQLNEALEQIDGFIDLPEITLDDVENDLEDRT